MSVELQHVAIGSLATLSVGCLVVAATLAARTRRPRENGPATTDVRHAGAAARPNAFQVRIDHAHHEDVPSEADRPTQPARPRRRGESGADDTPVTSVVPTIITIPNMAMQGRRASQADTPVPLQASDRFDQVRALARAGRTPAEIAAATGIPLGQVEVAIRLDRLRSNPPEQR